QSGIKEIIYADDKYDGTPGVIASKRMLDAAGVKYHPYQFSGKKVELNL
ncbi:MAG: cytidine deaminase, partial [Lachnospiraceae bacterium]|nr:cytidine deaminase [Lachnospiraceae bacterium]